MNELSNAWPLQVGPHPPAPPGPREEDGARAYLKHVQGVIARRLVFIVVLASLSAALATYVISGLQPLYAASAELLVQQPKPAMGGLAALTGGLQQDFYTNETEASVLRSLDLATRVVAELNLDRHPWFNPSKRQPSGPLAWINAQIASWRGGGNEPPDVGRWTPGAIENAVLTAYFDHLTVQASDRSRVITIKFVAPTAELSAAVVTKLTEIYIRQQIELRQRAQNRETDWLTDQSNGLREKVLESQRKLEEFRASQGLSAAASIEALTRQLADYNTQLLAARVRRVEVESRAQQIGSMAAGSGADNAPAVMDNPIIQRLREQQIQAARKLGELRERLRPEHPEVLAAKAELDQLSAPLKAETAKVVSSAGVAARLARDQEVALQAQVRDLRSEIAARAEAETGIRTLEVELKTNTQLFETLLARLKEASALDEQVKQADARVISAASIPDRAFYPNKPMLMGTAAAIALAVAIGLAFLLEFLDPSFRTRADVEDATGLDIAGVILRAPGGTKNARPRALLQKPANARFAESIRSLRVMLTLRHIHPDPMVIMVTSAVPDEGKSFSSVMLATSYASAGTRAVILDCDLRNPALGRHLKGDGAASLTDFLAGKAKIEDALDADSDSGVDFMRASFGGDRVDPPLLLGSARMDELLRKLKTRFDVIILDTPPVTLFPDALVLQRFADRVLFCIQWGKTPRELVLGGLKALAQGDMRAISLAMTQVDPRRQSQFDYDGPGAGRFEKYYARQVAAGRGGMDGSARA